ncbi:Histone-lysine N-methyltransferase SETMAR-like [Oopsacas minuta]|uniref:Histone-lysine N-methyltransferase SETMAR-like n=1 Tax=Oopsacas minuta TaxID=111878 RepID=A0AAV7JPP0_9METZ|nr:Histone-lysine N-methyltransferase SETMAR-like [Oopsacas minuta]
MWTIFFRSSEFVEAVALEDRKTVTADWYTIVCLPKVITAIESQREKKALEEFFFIMIMHHRIRQSELVNFWKILDSKHYPTHPPYSPDLAPCDFWLFPRLKHQ